MVFHAEHPSHIKPTDGHPWALRPRSRRASAATRAVVALATLLLAPRPAPAVLLYGSTVRNTTEPRNSLAGSGWQWEGLFNDYLGTPISKHLFITASHIGGGVGDKLDLAGKDYRTIRQWTDPNSDLRIYEIAGSMPTWAPLQQDSDEVGQTAIFFGRGTARGAAVTVDGTLRGWQWGDRDHVESWGRGIITAAAPRTGADDKSIGSLLEIPFSAPGAGGIRYQGAISNGDSGGGVFIQDDGRWTLAGIAYAADGPFSYTDGGATFHASLFDARGIWEGDQKVPDDRDPVPTFSYATRISDHLKWIDAVMDGRLAPTTDPSPAYAADPASITPVPEPATLTIAAAALLATRRRRPS